MKAHFALTLAGLLMLAPAVPVHAETNALGNTSPLSVRPSADAAGPNQLFPPLPSLASLPPSAGEPVEDPAPAAGGRRHAKKGHRAAPHKTAEATVRVVVSEASQAYLAEVESKLDDALHGPPRDVRLGASAVSLAQAR